ncbi:MAG: phosphopyruvate hydratase, partial [Bdellovibrionales bacterium]|nr:phosphopyruvate hydratase [Bdellovibrionales bacterium]
MNTKANIQAIDALEVLDSRGFPTVQVIVKLDNGIVAQAMVPSGASTGEYEAHELRDGEKDRFMGKGVQKAVTNIVESIAPALQGMNVLELKAIDERLIELDGTENKTKLGANAILGVSIACAQAGAAALGIPLFRYLGGSNASQMPVPLVNVINGGAHAANSLDFQEFMLVPHCGDSFARNIRAASEVFHTLKKNLLKDGHTVGLGDEGGFAPNLGSSEEAIKVLLDAISDAGYQPGKDFSLALDVAASEFYDRSKSCYILKKSSGEELSSKDLIGLYADWAKRYPLVSIEDGLDENDWDGWQALTAELGSSVQLVGDDLFVTNSKRLQMGIDQKAGNAILIKLNQIGTVSETLATIELGRKHGYRSVISHRSGETEDTTIA